jgi:hypothetical protein
MTSSRTDLPSRPTKNTLFFLYNFVRMSYSRIARATGWTEGQIGAGIRRWDLKMALSVADHIGQALGDRAARLLHVEPHAFRARIEEHVEAGKGDWRKLAEALPNQIEELLTWTDEDILKWLRVDEHGVLLSGDPRRQLPGRP